ncbi:hypothetical protein EI94DRAFT_865930 [Lactarius quietus]|nr:hypothetical protein EI94DRAFT_865930 [Lactarius quietus]
MCDVPVCFQNYSRQNPDTLTALSLSRDGGLLSIHSNSVFGRASEEPYAAAGQMDRQRRYQTRHLSRAQSPNCHPVTHNQPEPWPVQCQSHKWNKKPKRRPEKCHADHWSWYVTRFPEPTFIVYAPWIVASRSSPKPNSSTMASRRCTFSGNSNFIQTKARRGQFRGLV